MSWVKKNVALFLLLGSAFLLFLPTLSLPYSLIDDWETLKITEEATTALLSGNLVKVSDLFIEISYGRFRLGYWIYQWTFTSIFQENPTLNHFGRILVLLLTLTLLFWITEKLSRSKTIAFLAGAFFLFSGPPIENWIRLGPAEVPLLLFLLVSLASLIAAWERQKSTWLVASFVFLGLAYITKETGVMLLPVSIVLLAMIPRERRRFAYKYLGANIIYTLLILSLVLIIKGSGIVGQAANYQFNLEAILSNLVGYLGIITRGYNILWILLLATFTLRVLIKRKLGGLEWFQIFALSWFFSGFLLQLPWRYVLGRYLLPISAPLAMFFATEIVVIAKKFQSGWLGFGQVILGILLFLFAFQGLVDGATFFRDTFARDYGHHQALTFVAQKMPQNGRLFINFSKAPGAVEWPFGLKNNLARVYKRPDIRVVQLEAGQVYQEGDYIFDWSANREFDPSRLKNMLPKEAKVVKSLQTFGVASGTALIQSLLIPTKERIIAIFGIPFPHEWTIYEI